MELAVKAIPARLKGQGEPSECFQPLCGAATSSTKRPLEHGPQKEARA